MFERESLHLPLFHLRFEFRYFHFWKKPICIFFGGKRVYRLQEGVSLFTSEASSEASNRFPSFGFSFCLCFSWSPPSSKVCSLNKKVCSSDDLLVLCRANLYSTNNPVKPLLSHLVYDTLCSDFILCNPTQQQLRRGLHEVRPHEGRSRLRK